MFWSSLEEEQRIWGEFDLSIWYDLMQIVQEICGKRQLLQFCIGFDIFTHSMLVELRSPSIWLIEIPRSHGASEVDPSHGLPLFGLEGF